MLYGALSPIASLIPGEKISMFDGTETAAANLKSAAFSRGNAGGQPDSGITFAASGMPAGSVIQIQGSLTDVDGDYYVIFTMNPDANGNAVYTDVGYSTFYRAVLSTYIGGAMPILKAQR